MIEPFHELLDNFCNELELTNSPFDLVQKKFIKAYFTEQAVALGYPDDIITRGVSKEISRRLGEKYTNSFPYCNKEFKRQNDRGFYGLKMPQELEEKQRVIAKSPDSIKEKEEWRKQNLKERAQVKKMKMKQQKEGKKKEEKEVSKEGPKEDMQDQNKEDQKEEIEEESESELSEEEYVTTTGRKGALKVETPPKEPKKMIRRRRKKVSFKLPDSEPEEQPQQKPAPKPATRTKNRFKTPVKPPIIKKPIKAQPVVEKLHTEITKVQESESQELVAVSHPNMEQQLQKRSKQVEQLKTQNAYLLKKLLEYKVKCEQSQKKQQKRQRVNLT